MYTIVFEDSDTNGGDQPMLTPSDTFSGTASIRVRKLPRTVTHAACCGVPVAYPRALTSHRDWLHALVHKRSTNPSAVLGYNVFQNSITCESTSGQILKTLSSRSPFRVGVRNNALYIPSGPFFA